MSKVVKSFFKDKLHVRIYVEKSQMGEAAADFVVDHLRAAIREKETANLILATGTSQFSFLESLKNRELDWDKITVFHLDEYMELPEDHPASFRKYLKDRILDIVDPGEVYFLNGDSDNLQEEIETYEELLKKHPIDVACIGIGENGHIAFNDPPVADFEDPKWVKVVELDEACRRQQLNEGWFSTLEEVPQKAVTLTITAIMNSRMISCFVPGERKARAVKKTLDGPISTSCPASILRNHPSAALFLDLPSSSSIKNGEYL